MGGPAGSPVDVWVADLDDDHGGEELLSPSERDRASRFHFARDRWRFVAGRLLVRRLVATRLGVPPAAVRFDVGPVGKPCLASPAEPLEFNLSRSGSVGLVAISASLPVGVDIEWVDSAVDLSGRFLAPREHAAIDRLPAAVRVAGFYACWTRKEAVLKAVGLGLSFPLDAFEVNADPAAPPVLLRATAPIDAARWCLHDLPVAPGYRACLATPGEIDVRLHSADRPG